MFFFFIFTYIWVSFLVETHSLRLTTNLINRFARNTNPVQQNTLFTRLPRVRNDRHNKNRNRDPAGGLLGPRVRLFSFFSPRYITLKHPKY